ncbi:MULTISPECIES: YkgJ family cysteine cluster protein [Haloferax]|uniref:YkgJ family cysteine cluster protein n=1 Tax=Haloferax marinum TaxID=2666143 RepID=A0A6A8G7C6_9EURY|nr:MULTISPECIES: YkgJ family cysteine cluster protein [Haloferax]KAB1197623.1 YkgJ family cysteine cluster protein [Haloferax sp. CBA1150]MRW96675.1 YkgJ family cysteine cluster protein [Haloferax marinum]
MRVDCEGCAGCCIDWRPVSPVSLDHERRGPRAPLDDTYNLVPLTRDEVRNFVEAGLGDVLTPRLWEVPSGEGVEIDGVEVATIGGNPAFFVGMRKPPKPVAPFGLERTWLRACAFLDPETLQCRIHDTELYPNECAEYPGHNLTLGQETECGRVEASYGGERLLDDTPPTDQRGLLLGPHALGAKLFVHPDPTRLDGVVDRLRTRSLTLADRAEFVGVAVGSRPGSTEVDDERARNARTRTLETASWAGELVDEWSEALTTLGAAANGAPHPDDVEVSRGAPETPGWDAIHVDN